MVRRFQNAGFTLTELIVVLILAGIMAAVAIPRLGGENVFRERGFHDAVVAALGHARKVAVASRRFVCARRGRSRRNLDLYSRDKRPGWSYLGDLPRRKTQSIYRRGRKDARPTIRSARHRVSF